jgi:hypothetical protein
MLTGNHYFSLETKPEVISAYFHNLENILDTNNNRIILLGDFNAPGLPGTLVHLCLNVTTIPPPPHVFLV